MNQTSTPAPAATAPNWWTRLRTPRANANFDRRRYLYYFIVSYNGATVSGYALGPVCGDVLAHCLGFIAFFALAALLERAFNALKKFVAAVRPGARR